MADTEHWSLDKRIPVAVIVTLAAGGLGQTVTMAWAMSNLWTRVSAVEDFVKTSGPQATQIAVMQEKMVTLQTSLDRMEAWLRTNLRFLPTEKQTR